MMRTEVGVGATGSGRLVVVVISKLIQFSYCFVCLFGLRKLFWTNFQSERMVIKLF